MLDTVGDMAIILGERRQRAFQTREGDTMANKRDKKRCEMHISTINHLKEDISDELGWLEEAGLPKRHLESLERILWNLECWTRRASQ